MVYTSRDVNGISKKREYKFQIIKKKNNYIMLLFLNLQLIQKKIRIMIIKNIINAQFTDPSKIYSKFRRLDNLQIISCIV
jgi:hypothetical protein